MWDKVAARARNWPGRVLISHEILGISRPHHIERIAATLHPSVLHVVVMARCVAELLPSAYQEKVKQVGPHPPWSDFVQQARPGGGDHWVQDVGSIVRRWPPYVAPDRLHVVVVPPRGTHKEVLLDRFTGVLGVDRDGFTLDDVDVNASLDSIELRLLQIVLARSEVTLSLRQRRGLVERDVVPVLRRISRSRRPLRIPLALTEVMVEESRRQIAGIRATGCRVHGDLDELVPSADAFAADSGAPEDVPVEDLLALAVDAWIGSLTDDARG